MAAQTHFVDTFDNPAPDEVVVFSVLCQPKSGIGMAEFRRTLTAIQTRPVSDQAIELDKLRPSDQTRERVADGLRKAGFEVLEGGNPLVFARGTVAQFLRTFGGELTRLTRRPSDDARSTRVVTAIILQRGSAPPSVSAIEGALLLTLAEPPILVDPRIGPKPEEFCLHLPGDVAQMTGASATHRQSIASGKSATGHGVTVAVVDTGFAEHPYFDDHAYRITRLAAPDTQDPEIDDDDAPHGTYVLANLLACAPDVNASGIKFGRVELAFWTAMQVYAVKVISLSWAYPLDSTGIPDWLVSLEFLILLALVDLGITIVVAAGNGEVDTFPAVMPGVIAVGGVIIGPDDSICVWPLTSSFSSAVFPGRDVPDLCGIASSMLVPVPESGGGSSWTVLIGGTSAAAPQVAGVAALLLQKSPALTPQGVRAALFQGAADVKCGNTDTGKQARPGPDPATGHGFVNALAAWNVV